MFATVPPPPQRLLVFARLPVAGEVKTRLAAEVGEEHALRVYEAMLRDVVATVSEPIEGTEVEFLWPPSPAANGDALRAAFGRHAVAVQTGKTLGDRLCMAFSERLFFHRTERIVAIGVDDPSLPRDLLAGAFSLLHSCEYVIGPAADGGYYLFGCRAPSFEPVVFEEIDWGGPTVLRSTLERISRTGRTVALLPERYDIDTAADLERYAAEGHGGELGRLLSHAPSSREAGGRRVLRWRSEGSRHARFPRRGDRCFASLGINLGRP